MKFWIKVWFMYEVIFGLGLFGMLTEVEFFPLSVFGILLTVLFVVVAYLGYGGVEQ
jgi:hypothetical protein